jgi:hypothetical protein
MPKKTDTQLKASAAASKGWASGRRRGVDPATTDRIYTDEEREFLCAVERWKKQNSTPLPTMAEVFAIARALGYRKVALSSAIGAKRKSV